MRRLFPALLLRAAASLLASGAYAEDISLRVFAVAGTPLFFYQPFRSERLNINSWGLRSREPVDKEGGELRVLVLGGAAVFGRGLSDRETVPALLEEALQRRLPQAKVRVYNLGIEGYTFSRSVELALHMMPRLRPDWMLFCVEANNFVLAHRNGYPRPAAFTEASARRLAEGQEERDGSARALELILGLTPERPPRRLDAEKLEENLSAFVSGCLDDMQSVQSELRARGVGSTFLVFPTLSARRGRTRREDEAYARQKESFRDVLDFYERALDRLTVAAARRGLELHRLEASLDGAPGDIFEDWARPGAEGSCLITEAAAERVQKALAAVGSQER